MSKGREKKSKRTSPSSSRYGVGFGKPPQESQFKPGTSGNPKGRPKGSKNKPRNPHDQVLRRIIIDEAYRDIDVQEGPRTVKVPMAVAVVRAIQVAAVRGNAHAQRLATELLKNAEAAIRADHENYVRVLRDYKDYWENELERRRRAGITDLPDPVPHPDHIEFDFEHDTVLILGPKSQREKDELDSLIANKEFYHGQLVAALKKRERAKTRAETAKANAELEEVAEVTRLIQYFDPEVRRKPNRKRPE